MAGLEVGGGKLGAVSTYVARGGGEGSALTGSEDSSCS